MKKILSAFLVIVMALIGFTACTDGNQSGGVENNGSDENGDIVDNGGSIVPPTDENEEITEMFLTINGNKIEVALAENSAVGALVEILKQGDIVYTARDYGGFEKVGSLGHTLPTENTQITTEPGDVILYSGNQIVLFYGSNEWSYTRLGKINGYSVEELKTLLGAGDGSVQVTISLK